ncbi:MAG: fibronectin type III domain-containing protein, partial [Clostridia bacterium]|nr:fibronectin type III domain-containing protein [Clostridia bacterium]
MTTLGSLVVGAKIKVHHDVIGNIVFQVADQNHDGYPSNSTTLITEKIILLRCFDAKEPSNPNSDR